MTGAAGPMGINPAATRADDSPPVAGPTGAALADPRALQILASEFASLSAMRSLAYNEAFTRAGMFLTFLSATLVVTGFLIGSQGLSSSVVPVAALLLLADVYAGAATVGRLIGAGGEELECLRGMNRIRHAYVDMVPGLEPLFVTGFHDDRRGVLAFYGDIGSKSFIGNVAHGLTTTIGMIFTIDSMVVGALCCLVLLGLGASVQLALVVGIVGFLLSFVVFTVFVIRLVDRQQEGRVSRFPTPPDGTA